MAQAPTNGRGDDDRATISVRADVPEPPRGRALWRWYGPGLLWMISSVGSGSVLFTPRVGGRYGYALLWLLVGVIFLMWVMIREIGRYTVVTGRTILDGFRDIPGGYNWAVWLIFVPQVVACIATIAGIAALLGSVVMTGVAGSQALYASIAIVLACVLVVTGRYKRVEQVTSAMAVVLTLSAVAAAALVFPSMGDLTWGMRPGLPPEPDYYFILPWVGFILAGAAGMMWFSYWVGARGYGGSLVEEQGERGRQLGLFDGDGDDERTGRLKKWIRVMSTAAGIGVGAGGITIISFLILGAELLAPQGIVPEGVGVAEDLTLLLSEVWGRTGFWLLIVSMGIALWGTIISDADGWGRMFADASIMLLGPRPADDDDPGADRRGPRLMGMPAGVGDGLALIFGRGHREWLKRMFVIGAVTIVPLVVFFLLRNPVDILSVGGIVAAAHTPVVVYLTLYLNLTRLPRALRPGWFIVAVMVFAGIFYGGFAVLHLLSLVGVRLL